VTRLEVLRGIVGGRPLAGPETVHLDVTNGCNAACVTCWDHSPLLAAPRPPAWKRQRVDPAAIEALLAELDALGGLRQVILSGQGEPLTHPEIDRLAAAVKARGLRLTIITNLLAADPERILALAADQLLVGIHAASAPAYLAFHPGWRAADWDRLHAALGRLAAAGRPGKHVHVICAPNAHELPDMVRLAGRYRAAEVGFKLAGLAGGTEACRVTAAQRRRLAEELVPAAARVAAELGVATNLDVFARQLAAGGAATAPIRDVGCFMGYVYTRVLVDGTVLYCCDAEVAVGTLAGGARFADLWTGPAWTALRARFRRGDYLPGCDRCGKLAQNVKLRRRLADAYGEAVLGEVTGRGTTP